MRVHMNCGRMYVPDYFDFSIVHTYAGVYTYIFVSVYMCMAHRIQTEHACVVHAPTHTITYMFTYNIRHYGYKLVPLKTRTRAEAHSAALTIARMAYMHAMPCVHRYTKANTLQEDIQHDVVFFA